MLNLLLAISPIQIAGGAIVALLSIVLIIIILSQSGSDAGLGSIEGGAESFLGKNKAHSVNEKFKRATKWLAVLFGAVIVAMAIISKFVK